MTKKSIWNRGGKIPVANIVLHSTLCLLLSLGGCGGNGEEADPLLGEDANGVGEKDSLAYAPLEDAIGTPLAEETGESFFRPPLLFPRQWSIHIDAAAPQIVRTTAEELVALLPTWNILPSLEETEGEIGCDQDKVQIVFTGESVGPIKFNGETNEQTWRVSEERCGNGSQILLMGGGILGRQYAAYALLHHLGVRYFHPEETFYPETLTWSENPIEEEVKPAFTYRTVGRNMGHPIELGDVFLHEPKISGLPDEAKNYVDWLIHNGASGIDTDLGHGGTVAYARARGIHFQAQIPLYSGPDAWLDPDTTDAESKIISEIEKLFGPFSLKPEELLFDADGALEDWSPEEVEAHLNLLGYAVQDHAPTARISAITNGENPEILAILRKAHLKISVLSGAPYFFDLFRPIPILPIEGMSGVLDYFNEQSALRSLGLHYTPTSWGGLDLDIPLYLPIGLDGRARDMEGLSHLVGNGLETFYLRGSGQEWGAWQAEYCGLRMAAQPSGGIEGCLSDLTAPFGDVADEVSSALSNVISLQEQDLIHGELLPYLAAKLPGHEEMQIVAPEEVLSWESEEVIHWKNHTAPRLEAMDESYREIVEALDLLHQEIPVNALPFFREILDGIEVTGLRARHVRSAYGAAVLLRQFDLFYLPDDLKNAGAFFTEAKKITRHLLSVIHTRESDYRYRGLHRAIGGGPWADADANWTRYPYRYLNPTHYGRYHQELEAEVDWAFRLHERVLFSPNIVLGPDEPLEVTVIEPGSGEATVLFGDGEETTTALASHTYSSFGTFSVSGDITVEDMVVPQSYDVFHLPERWNSDEDNIVVLPEGLDITERFFPFLSVGRLDPETLVLGYARTEEGLVEPGHYSTLSCTPTGPEDELLLDCASEKTVIPVLNRPTKTFITSLPIYNLTLQMAKDSLTVYINGDLRLKDAIDPIIAIIGFEEDIVLEVLLTFLGYPPGTPLEALPKELAFATEFYMTPYGTTEEEEGDNPSE